MLARVENSVESARARIFQEWNVRGLWTMGLWIAPHIWSLTSRARFTYILLGMLVRKTPNTRKRRSRDPQRTQKLLLQAAFEEIHKSGFEGADLDTILAATDVTEGARSYHLASKLGYGRLRAVLSPNNRTRLRWAARVREEV